MAGGDTGHGGCRGWQPHQPQDGKREFSFLDSFLANKKGREKQTGEILNQKRILQQKKDAKPAE